MRVYNQEDRPLGVHDQAFKELNNNLRCHPLLDGHKPKIAPPADGRDQIDSEPSVHRRYNRRPAARYPGRPRMRGRTNSRLVRKPNLCLHVQGVASYRRIFGLKPVLDFHGILLISPPERPLSRKSHLIQKTGDRRPSQGNAELAADDVPNHHARPESELELVLTGIPLHSLVNPGQGPAVELGGTTAALLGVEPSPSASPIADQPTENGRAVDAENPGDVVGRFPFFDCGHPAPAEFGELGVSQASGIGCFRARKGSTLF